ncbi:MAG TPA: PqqD family protein [Thermoanaerobaculaceae bacterium]|nr:PqqD family protein [Thermoanaerobaculaceae bacterium]HPS78158.1 PqqD family protein [Thermoanaerobaculaceae bacterium]
MSGRLTEWTVVQSSGRQTVADLGTDLAVLKLDTSVYYTLSGSARWIWELLRNPTPVAEINRQLCERYDVEPARCREEVLTLLEQLVDEGLVEVRADPCDDKSDEDA